MSYNESRNADSNYPPMTQSQWDNAPFNEPAPNKEVDVSCGVSISLYHPDVMLSTDEYQVIEEEEGTYFDFEGCDLIKEYNASPLNILSLLAEFKEVLEDRKAFYESRIKDIENHGGLSSGMISLAEYKTLLRNVKMKIAMCTGWEVTDIHVEEE